MRFSIATSDLDWKAINELTSSGFEGGMARAPCGGGVCSGANSGDLSKTTSFWCRYIWY